MARKKKAAQPQSSQEEKLNDYEQFLIKKIARCEEVVRGLRDNRVWQVVKEDYEGTAKSLDMVWANEDVTSPRFKQMQVAKMAATTFLNLLTNYEYDLKMAKSELAKFQSPKEEIRKDYDEEGIESDPAPSKSQGESYYGR